MPFITSGILQGVKWLAGQASNNNGLNDRLWLRTILVIVSFFGVVAASVLNGTPIDANTVSDLVLPRDGPCCLSFALILQERSDSRGNHSALSRFYAGGTTRNPSMTYDPNTRKTARDSNTGYILAGVAVLAVILGLFFMMGRDNTTSTATNSNNANRPVTTAPANPAAGTTGTGTTTPAPANR